MAASKGGTNVINLPALFSDLNRLGEAGKYEDAIKVANKILQASPEDDKAFHYKIVCLIHLTKFDECLTLLRKNQKLSADLSFEKAYCEYRLNRTDEALRTIQAVQNPEPRLTELLSQVLYRLENYEECFETYRKLLKETQDDYEEERETNLSAAVASLRMWNSQHTDCSALREDTHELCYNAACLLIGQRSYSEALAKLEKAEEICRESFEGDTEATKEDIEAELAIIWVQKGYVYQKLGQTDAAMRLYSQVVKQRPSDVAVAAVASNNVVTLNKDQNLFDSKKKIKAAMVDSLKQKLVSHQKQAIAHNECLLHLYSGQSDQCRRTAQALQKAQPDSHVAWLIEAAQCVKDKNMSKALQIIQDQIDRTGEGGDVVRLKLTLCQLLLSEEKVYQACDVLKSLNQLSHQPGIVSALVALYISEEDRDSAVEVLNNAINHHKKNKGDTEVLYTLIRAQAILELKNGSAERAAECLEQLRANDPKNLKILARLIAAYSKFNPQKAHEVSKQLPSADDMTVNIDVDALETSVGMPASKYSKKIGRTEASPRTAGSGTGQVMKSKSKKKKKKLLPKNYDPSVAADPERWLPLRERSYYRGKRKNRRQRDAIGKGTQGSTATTGANELDASKPTSPPTSDVGSPHPSAPGSGPGSGAAESSGPRQTKPAAANVKQRPKKKKGGKW